MQQVWGWSALTAGLALAPGPLMVPIFTFLVTGRLLGRYGPAAVIGVGAAVFAAGIAWWAMVVSLRPNYPAILPGILVTGIGVGLTLPSLMSTAAASLPPPSFATGSAVVNMLRQVGFAVGVAMLVAVLGAPHGSSAALIAFRHGWYATAGAGLAAAVIALVLRRRPAAVVPVSAAAGASGPG
jgi:MFS family permease